MPENHATPVPTCDLLPADAAGPPAPAGPEAPADGVPGYDLLGEVGRGGMGVVYKAHDRRLNRTVALKMILAGSHAGAGERARFRQEAETVARLQHPNIVQVFEVGEHAGHAYLALEFVAGGTLAQRTAGLPQPPRDAASLTELIAGAVGYAHRNGIIHRDLKPGNVLLTADGAPKLTDFGLAKLVAVSPGREPGGGLTATGAILGTPGYLAPEQAAGRPADLGPATDVYALGAMLYYLLTGRPPFQGATLMEALRLTETAEPVPPRRLNPAVPRDLETVCLKCLRKEPARRYPTAEALADDLRRFLADEPIRGRPVTRRERVVRWARRNPAVALLGALAVALLAVLAAGSTVAAVWLKGERDRAEAAERRGRLQLVQAHRDQARAGRLSRRPGQRFDSLRALQEAVRLARDLDLPADRFAELRTEAIACLMLPDLEVAREWDGFPAGSSGFALDATFSRYARGDAAGNVTVRRVEDDAELWRLPGVGRINEYDGIQFSPGGRCLFLYHRTRNGWNGRLWRLEDPPVLLREGIPPGFAFRPDGRECVHNDQADGSLHVLELPSGRELRRLAGGGRGIGVRMVWNPRLPRLLLNFDRQLRILDPANGTILAEWRLPDNRTFDWTVWHPEGRWIALAGSDMAIRFWDTFEGRFAPPVLEGHRSHGLILNFNRAGDVLISNDWHNNFRLWDVATGRQLLAQPALGATIQVDAADRLLAVDLSPPRARLFRLEPGREFRTVVRQTPSGPGLYAYTVGPARGGRLTAAYTGKGVALLDLARGEELALLPAEDGQPLLLEVDDRAVWTYGATGLLRWPLGRDADDAGLTHVGPPQRLRAGTQTNRWGSTPDGQLIAIPDGGAGALLVDRQHGRTRRLSPQADVRGCAVSPDGRWVATATHTFRSGAGVKVWDGATGRHVADLPVGGLGIVGFSPDNRWLATSNGGLRLWRVGTWEPGPPLGPTPANGDFAFSPDGQLLAFGDAPGVVRLVAPDTGRVVARLPTPAETRLAPRGFTPDGGMLILQGSESQALHLIDLRAIRDQLRPLGLDWDAPPLPAAAAPADAAPLRMRVHLGELEDDAVLGPKPTPAHLRIVVARNTVLLALVPFHGEAYRQRGRAYQLLKERPAALADFSLALALVPAGSRDCLSLLGHRATLNLERGADDLVQADLAEAARIDPLWAGTKRAWLAASLVRQAALPAQRRDPPAGLVLLRRAVGIGPEHAVAHDHLAWHLLTQPADPAAAEEALRHARRAVELDPDGSSGQTTLGLALVRHGRPVEAVAALDRALATTPGRPEAVSRCVLALAHARQGDPARARAELDRAAAWTAAQKSLPAAETAEIKALRAEAEAALGPGPSPNAQRLP